MFECIKCGKQFEFKSKLKEHNSRKTKCDLNKEPLNCTFCNINFTRLFNKHKHEKTEKHKKNVYNANNNNSYTQVNVNSNTTNLHFELQISKLKEENDKLLNKYNLLQLNTNLQINNLKQENKDLINKYELQINNLKQENTNLKNKYEIQINSLNQENTNLTNKYNLLQSLSNSNTQISSIEYIYVIHERTFVLTNTNIYKVGRTNDINRRFKQYSKGSKMVFTMPCNNSIEIETQILNYLKTDAKYVQAKEFGNEYFICNVNDLISDIYTFFNHI